MRTLLGILTIIGLSCAAPAYAECAPTFKNELDNSAVGGSCKSSLPADTCLSPGTIFVKSKGQWITGLQVTVDGPTTQITLPDKERQNAFEYLIVTDTRGWHLKHAVLGVVA